MKQKSKYSASAFDEVKRLELQSKATKKLDDKVINYVMKQGQFKDKNFFVLDVGCGYSGVAKSRFSKFENAKVLLRNQQGRCQFSKRTTWECLPIAVSLLIFSVEKILN